MVIRIRYKWNPWYHGNSRLVKGHQQNETAGLTTIRELLGPQGPFIISQRFSVENERLQCISRLHEDVLPHVVSTPLL